MAEEDLIAHSNPSKFGTTSNTDIQKAISVDVEQFDGIDTLQEPTDSGLELCIVRFLNNIIKLLNTGALAVIIPIKALFAMIQSKLALLQVFNAIDIQRKSRELMGITKKFFHSITDKFKKPEGGLSSNSTEEKENNLIPIVAQITKNVYDASATEIERNLNNLKDNFKLNLSLPDCLKGTIDLDKPIELPKFGSGDEKTMQNKAFKRLNKLEAKLQKLLAQKDILQRQINTINKLFPTIEKVQELINLKVGIK